jgi:hypothetical protein
MSDSLIPSDEAQKLEAHLKRLTDYALQNDSPLAGATAGSITSAAATLFPPEDLLQPPLGRKYDALKPSWDLLPYDALAEIVKVLDFGAKKYDERNWENGIAYSRLFAAAQRHLISWFQHKEDLDPESNLNHLAHAGCCVLFALALQLRHTKEAELDDRPKK